MAQLKEVVAELETTNSRDTHNIAGYIEDKTFYYHISNNENLPAAVLVMDTFGKQKGMIYTNLRKDHWIHTYTGSSDADSQKALTYVPDSDVTVSGSKVITRQLKCWVVAGAGPSSGPLGSGLFQAAKDLAEKKAIYKGADKVYTEEKGLHRALRYYMLAAYAVLGKCANSGYTGGNYIAALMVDDKGKILSYGVNSGWYHHGEVNMLLNYFTANPSARQFPSKTIVFSTLTPCKQCSKYLESSRPAESVIFMGQKDTGSLGQVGEKYGVYLSAVTDSILNRVAQPIMKSRVVGSTTVKGWGGKTSTVPVTEQYQEGEKVSHYEVDSSLSEKMGQGATVAEQIGQKCNQILIQSMSTLTHKFDKERPTSQERLDQGVKIPVLNYLKLWIESVNSTSRQI